MAKWLKPHKCPVCGKEHTANQSKCSNCYGKERLDRLDPDRVTRREQRSKGICTVCGNYKGVGECPTCARGDIGISVRAKINTINRRSNGTGTVKRQEVIDLYHSQTTCAYCGEPLNSNNTHVDHIEPLSKGGLNVITNLQLTCNFCNLAKQDRSDTEFRHWLKKIAGRWA